MPHQGASALTKDIFKTNLAKTRFNRKFLEDFSFDRRGAIDITPTQSVSGGIGGSLKPSPAPTPRFITPRPEFVAPKFDERRARSLTQELAAPGRARLRRRLQEGLLQTRRDNPNLQAQLQKGLFAGFGEAAAANLATAQEGGFRQANIELGLATEEAQTNFQAALAERDKVQSQMIAAEQAGDEREFQRTLIELRNKNAILADQQDFLQQLEAQSIAFQNQFIRDILATTPSATTGPRKRARSFLSERQLRLKRPGSDKPSPTTSDNGIKKSGDIAEDIETFFL